MCIRDRNMVHQYKFDGQGVVLDTCSGAVHLVDDVAYDIIELWPDSTPGEIERVIMERYGGRDDVTVEAVRECISDVAALVDAKQLYTPDTYEGMAGEFKPVSYTHLDVYKRQSYERCVHDLREAGLLLD